ncbi:hypothetical protein SADUNF_Sadunf02G0088100 [Salix dunnii]|uniref:Uncharacterized protein n=1 Tax=Salix dunnii TaxID=1413687 RepID=A0A835N736_9ROSI|nr:hypothetical protein SADUNF_Sadunf02G0088100 [Salix dunnii]
MDALTESQIDCRSSILSAGRPEKTVQSGHDWLASIQQPPQESSGLKSIQIRSSIPTIYSSIPTIYSLLNQL